MKIVIDIDKEDWKDINDIHFIREDLKFKIGKVIMKGTPLPEDRGRLIDYGSVVDAIDDWINAGEYSYTNATDYLRKRIIDVPPIIEANKGVLEKINEKQNSLRATCKAWEEAISRDGYVN